MEYLFDFFRWGVLEKIIHAIKFREMTWFSGGFE